MSQFIIRQLIFIHQLMLMFCMIMPVREIQPEIILRNKWQC